jgi:hypothetical protein
MALIGDIINSVGFFIKPCGYDWPQP